MLTNQGSVLPYDCRSQQLQLDGSSLGGFGFGGLILPKKRRAAAARRGPLDARQAPRGQEFFHPHT